MKMSISDFLEHPMTLPKSLLLSLRFSCGAKPYKLPVIASWRTVIKCSKSARISLDGAVRLGYFKTRLGEVGKMRYDRTFIQLAPNSSLALGNDVIIAPGNRINLAQDSSVFIGDHTFIHANSRIFCFESIHIGRNCAISWDVQILDSDIHTFIDEMDQVVNPAKEIHIGDHVWIGCRSTIRRPKWFLKRPYPVPKAHLQ